MPIDASGDRRKAKAQAPKRAKTKKKKTKKPKGSRADLVLRLLSESESEFFHDLDNVAYASLPLESGGVEICRVESSAFSRFLSKLYFEEASGGLTKSTLADVCTAVAARAVFDGVRKEVHVRVARTEDAVYLDLANPERQIVKVTATGWNLVVQAPPAFRRPNGVRPLPVPLPGGDLDDLRQLVNVPDDSAWDLVVGWLLTTLRGLGPYPILAIGGEQGSAKTTLSKILRRLVDPAKVDLRAPPRDEQNLAVAASNCLVCALDNLSGVPLWLSDGLCRVASGGGFGTRALYTNYEEALFDLCNPILLNGIEDLGHRGDLLERCVTITLPRIPKENRRIESEVWAAFEDLHPYVLGALLDLCSAALAREAEVEIDELPRMADAAVWVTAAQGHTRFLDALRVCQQENALRSLEADPLAIAVFELLRDAPHRFEGTATQLLAAFTDEVKEDVSRRKNWPRTAHHLSNRLMRLAPGLRNHGVVFERTRDGSRRRVRLYRDDEGDAHDAQ